MVADFNKDQDDGGNDPMVITYGFTQTDDNFKSREYCSDSKSISGGTAFFALESMLVSVVERDSKSVGPV